MHPTDVDLVPPVVLHMTMVRNVTARYGVFIHGIAVPRAQLNRQGRALGDTDRSFNDRLTVMLVHADPEELRGGHVGTDMKYDCCVGSPCVSSS